MYPSITEETSEQFERFLKLMGDKIELAGWQGYRGDLDVSYNKNGEHSFYTKLGDIEVILQLLKDDILCLRHSFVLPLHDTVQVMFHVSTYLPYDPLDPQQIPRKKYIGNDLVTIVFLCVQKSFFSFCFFLEGSSSLKFVLQGGRVFYAPLRVGRFPSRICRGSAMHDPRC